METLWFGLFAAMIAVYVILDGFDLGAGAVHLLVGRTEGERARVLQSIGPFWDGNEVWLIAAGGTLFLAFPSVYAASFSGFYLPLNVVLWLLILRGIGIEFRNHVDSRVWTPLWDRVFSFASALLAVFFGAALGNVVRGVPLDDSGRFFSPLWTDFTVSGERLGILDWYTTLAGLAALIALSMHGALWIAHKTDGKVQERARRWAQRLWAPTVLVILGLTAATFVVQPHVRERMLAPSLGIVFPALALVGLMAILVCLRKQRDGRAFLSSAVFLGCLMASMAYGVFPYLLPSSIAPEYGMTVFDSAAPAYGLRIGIYWWIPGMVLATGYFVLVYRRLSGKVLSPSTSGSPHDQRS